MKRRLLFLQIILLLVVIPSLACGPAALQVTPTPTKTPKRVRALPQVTATATVAMAPTVTPTPTIPPTDTPVPIPPTDTPTPTPPPTDTPPPPPTDTPAPPPPPPTNTPVPPPPTNTPAPAAPTQPPPSPGPAVVIDLPDGDTIDVGEQLRVRITVSDSDGVGKFSWGVFTENKTALQGGDHDCGGSTSCQIEESFEAPLPGAFFVGVEAKDRAGNGSIVTRSVWVN